MPPLLSTTSLTPTTQLTSNLWFNPSQKLWYQVLYIRHKILKLGDLSSDNKGGSQKLFFLKQDIEHKTRHWISNPHLTKNLKKTNLVDSKGRHCYRHSSPMNSKRCVLGTFKILLNITSATKKCWNNNIEKKERRCLPGVFPFLIPVCCYWLASQLFVCC